jgi:folate-binding protein YgfZ
VTRVGNLLRRVGNGIRLDLVSGQARALVRLRGPDARRFLQGTVTADVERVGPDEAVPSALLTVKAKLVSELVVLAPETDVLELLVPADAAEEVAGLLERHIVMDDVEVERAGAPALGLVWPAQAIAGASNVRAYAARHPAPGVLLVGDPTAVDAVLRDHAPADAEAFARHCIATASPRWGREIVAGALPPECGFVYAVSYDKGCFMGQEPLARLHARGQTHRVLVRLQGDRAPDDAIDLQRDGKTLGRWTSWAGEGDRAIGLALVRREVATPGTALVTAGEHGIAVVVTSAPLGDDPGVESRGGA